MPNNPTYSIVIPAYNESARIGRTLDRVLESVRSHDWDAEIIVVNDGSRDNTSAILKQYSARETTGREPSVVVVDNQQNRGKGYSICKGIEHSRGRIVMFTDADLSAPMDEARFLFDAIQQGADIAIGSRWLERNRQTHRQPLYRQLFGRCFNLITRTMMGLPFADTQCGFKAFRREVALRLFAKQKIERWGFDPEILFLATKLGYRVKEVPVTWAHDERSRISYLRDGLRMLQEMMWIRWYSLTGAYALACPRCVGDEIDVLATKKMKAARR